MKRLTVLFFVVLNIMVLVSIGSAFADTPISSLPFNTITEPGSYYLTGNLGGTLTVNADNVTIDLKGYSITGSGKQYVHGILIRDRYDGGVRANVEIRNGTVENFHHGIATEANGRSHRIINVTVRGNIGHGIYLKGGGHLVKNCTSYDNGNTGIFVWGATLVIENTSLFNGNDGIFAARGTVIRNNVAQSNGGNGIKINAGHCLIDSNTAYANGLSNIDCIGCTIGLNHAP